MIIVSTVTSPIALRAAVEGIVDGGHELIHGDGAVVVAVECGTTVERLQAERDADASDQL